MLAKVSAKAKKELEARGPPAPRQLTAKAEQALRILKAQPKLAAKIVARGLTTHRPE
jgi:hypothetical protein